MVRDARGTRSAAEITRKDMKRPDRFQVAVAAVAEWMAGRRKQFLLALAAAALALIAALAVRAWMVSAREDAGGLLYRTLDAADGEITAVPLPNLDRQTFRSQEEKDRAVVEAAAAVRVRHPRTAAARTAALAAGAAQLRLGEWDAAAASFEEFLAGARSDDPLRFAALDGLARVREGKGDLAGAAQAFERAGQEVPFYRDRAALERARVLARAGKADEARKVLQAFPDQFKDSPLRAEALERLARLGAP